MDLKIYSFEIDTSDIKAGGETRSFSIIGNPGAVFSLVVNNEDSPLKYYNFTTKSFSTTDSRLKNITIPSSGVYTNSIKFPSVTDNDHYNFDLFAESFFNTSHVSKKRELQSDGVGYVDYGSKSIGSKSSRLRKTIYQYVDTRIDFAVASKAVSGQYTSMPGNVIITKPRYTKEEQTFTADIDWTVTAQPAIAETYALTVIRQPLETDFEIMQTVTVDGTISSSTTVVVDDISGLFVGMTLDKIHSSYETSSIATITHLNTASKTITLDTAKSAGDGQNLIFVGGGYDDIQAFNGARVRFSDLKVKTTDFTSTVNGATTSSQSITLDSVVGVRAGGEADGIKIEGIKFDNKVTQYVETVNHATKVITVTSNQTLEDNTILTFRGCANTANIKGKIKVTRVPSSNFIITLDLDNIILSSTS